MPQRSLTDRFCASRKVEGEAQIDYFDEDTTGLALRVFRSGAKSWMYRFSWDGKRKWMVLGAYPATSLAKARTLAEEAAQSLRVGTDPRTALASPTRSAPCAKLGRNAKLAAFALARTASQCSPVPCTPPWRAPHS